MKMKHVSSYATSVYIPHSTRTHSLTDTCKIYVQNMTYRA